NMNILILGGGGREHALADKVAAGKLCTGLYIAPGNAGTALLGKNVDIRPGDFGAVKAFVLEKAIDLVIVGPEAPLVAGISDFFAGDAALRDIPVIGPSSAGARLEGSKEFAKQFM